MTPPSNASASVGKRRVLFAMEAPGAGQVALAGDFNDWNPTAHPMKRKQGGAWEKFVLLMPGTYEYKFVVDGVWMEDPDNAATCQNSFGTRNSVVVIDPK